MDSKLLLPIGLGAAALLLFARGRGSDSDSGSDADGGTTGTDTGLGFGEEQLQRTGEQYAKALIRHLNQCLVDGDIPDPEGGTVDRARAIAGTATCAAEFAAAQSGNLNAEQRQVLTDATTQMAALWLEMLDMGMGMVDPNDANARSSLEIAIDIAVWGPIIGMLD